MYKKALASYWTTAEVDLRQDIVEWSEKLNDGERHFISHVLAFFAASDGIVNENLLERFASEVKIPEAAYFYGAQVMIENIHSEMYSLLIDTFIKDEEERNRLFCALETIPSIARKGEWAMKWTADDDAPFSVRLIAFAIAQVSLLPCFIPLFFEFLKLHRTRKICI